MGWKDKDIFTRPCSRFRSSFLFVFYFFFIPFYSFLATHFSSTLISHVPIFFVTLCRHLLAKYSIDRKDIEGETILSSKREDRTKKETSKKPATNQPTDRSRSDKKRQSEKLVTREEPYK